MDRALLLQVEKQAIFHRYPRALPVALFLLGLLITMLFVLNIEMSEATERKLRLDADAEALAARLERETSENGAYLKAAAALFSVNTHNSEAEFAQLVSDMSEGHLVRGALGMGWAEWATGADVDAIERRLNAQPRRDGTPIKVRPRPSDPAQRMAVVMLIEPLNTANLRAVGYDMYSHSVRRTAINEAIRLDRPVASGPVQLLQTPGSGDAGTLIYLPVYAKDGGQQGPARLKGFIYAPLKAHMLLQTAIADARSQFGHVALYDGKVAADRLLAQIHTPDPDGISLTRSFDFAGRSWVLVVQEAYSPGITSTSKFVLGFGIWASLLLMALTRMATSRAVDDRRVLEWLQGQSAIRNSLTRELNHRVKNTLANVLSIVALTRRRAHSIDEFADGLTGRLRALSATHDLLSQREWRDAPIHDVVRAELSPYLDPEEPHAQISGPDALLAPNDAMSLGLALHELSTNAAKYGAFSVPDGHVVVEWSVPDPTHCVLHWRESGGPPVSAPSRRGFGMDLIEKIVSRELDSKVDLSFDPSGVSCALIVPLRRNPEFQLRQGNDEARANPAL